MLMSGKMMMRYNLGSIPLEEKRAIADLLYNANSNDYINEKGFKQKLIDLLYNLGYYKDNESIFLVRKEK